MFKNELTGPSKTQRVLLALSLMTILMTACVSTVPSANDAVCAAWLKAMPGVSVQDTRQTREEVFIEREAFREICL